MMDHEATAKAVFNWYEVATDIERAQGYPLSAYARSKLLELNNAVAVALAERDAEVKRLKDVIHNGTVNSTNAFADLRAEVFQLKAERDAAYVRGLKRAREIASSYGWPVIAAIAAEIAKAGNNGK